MYSVLEEQANVKDSVTPAAASAEPVTLSKAPPPLLTPAVSRRQYEELDGDVLDQLYQLWLFPGGICHSAASEQKEQPKSYFSLRRFSTPALISPLYKPIDPGHASLPSFPTFGLSKTYKALKRRCTVTGGAISYSEHSRLSNPKAACASMPEEPIPLLPLNYGSTISCQQPLSPKPCLHFTMAFSPEERTLAVTVLGAQRDVPQPGGRVRAGHTATSVPLPPTGLCPKKASAPRPPACCCF